MNAEHPDRYRAVLAVCDALTMGLSPAKAAEQVAKLFPGVYTAEEWERGAVYAQQALQKWRGSAFPSPAQVAALAVRGLR